jgi:parallel beta-helix repeat protein
LGYEYTAQFLLGKTPHCYGKISERAKELRDDYECVYRHYLSQGIELPYTKIAADSIRLKASRSVLTALRVPATKSVSKQSALKASSIAYPAGAMEQAMTKIPANPIRVNVGESIQDALDKAALQKGWVIATAGLHKLPATLKIPSGVTLSGEGLSTILFLDPASGVRDAIVNAIDDLHDVILCDFVVEGAVDPDPGSDPNSRRSYRSTANRGGIIFWGQHEGQMKNITLRNVTVRNCTYNGVFISGAENLSVIGCDLNENGASVVPGPRLQHNLLLSHCKNITINDSRLDASPHGCGIALTNCTDATVANCELARNAWFGLLLTESKNITATGNLIEANDRSGIMAQYLYRGCENVTISKNLIQYNKDFGVESYSGKNMISSGNTFSGNGRDQKSNEKISTEKYIIMN